MSSHQTPRGVVALTAAVLFALALGTSLVPVAAHEEHDAEYRTHDIHTSFVVPRFGQAELDFEAFANETITWSVTTDPNTPLYVDIHTHAAQGTIHFYNESNVHEAGSDFVVPTDGTYSIYMQRSASTPANVTLKAAGLFAVTSTLGFELEEPAEETPAAPILFVLVAVAALAQTLRVHRPRNQ